MDYITEHEEAPGIHFHTYSFGSILAIDYLYPYRTKPSDNAMMHCKALITIGSPYEFINSYFKNFYSNRITHLGDNIQWTNIYSVSDALSTNFRNDDKEGDAQFGLRGCK
ncbi:hypothetical protein ASG31_07760 [Chryseobacterium sp. Leaf404]|uniref:hypothetical protein n=1 Tax=unclassified Chryseobacterium TaxID=2593645 RepID=UPI0006F46FC2|nr:MULTISPECIES: hypothetical protein [unclassified Chryseobacterium]KQT18601.1 hypothetical protein ASG31_07760 [Chryseobacterium sp. Leaf404]